MSEKRAHLKQTTVKCNFFHSSMEIEFSLALTEQFLILYEYFTDDCDLSFVDKHGADCVSMGLDVK